MATFIDDIMTLIDMSAIDLEKLLKMSLDSEMKSRKLALGGLNSQQLASRLRRGTEGYWML